MQISLATDRLFVRSLLIGDLGDFLEYRSDPDVCKFQGFQPMTEEQALRFLRGNSHAEFGGTGEWIQLGIELRAGGKLIGDIGLKPEGGETRIVEFGISLSSCYQKMGFAAESLEAVFELLFAKAGIHRIVGITDTENRACIRLMENLRFRREGEFKQSFWDEGGKAWRDEFLYAILAEEWGAEVGF